MFQMYVYVTHLLLCLLSIWDILIDKTLQNGEEGGGDGVKNCVIEEKRYKNGLWTDLLYVIDLL